MKTDLRNTAVFMIGGLAVGHSVFHWIIQSFVVLLPEIQQTFGLSAIAIGGLLASRELSSGIIRLPGGIISDMLRTYWGVLLSVDFFSEKSYLLVSYHANIESNFTFQQH